MCNKAWCTCKVFVLLSKPIAVLTFSLPSPSSLLKGTLRRRRQLERQISNKFNEPNNNSASESHFFVHFFAVPAQLVTTWNDQILSLLGNGNGKTINSTISVRTQARSLLFSSKLNSHLLSNWAPWNNREKKWKDEKSIFQRRIHGRRRCWIVRSLKLPIWQDAPTRAHLSGFFFFSLLAKNLGFPCVLISKKILIYHKFCYD